MYILISKIINYDVLYLSTVAKYEKNRVGFS